MMDFQNVLPSLVVVWQKSSSSLKPLSSQRLADSSIVFTKIVPGVSRSAGSNYKINSNINLYSLIIHIYYFYSVAAMLTKTYKNIYPPTLSEVGVICCYYSRVGFPSQMTSKLIQLKF